MSNAWFKWKGLVGILVFRTPLELKIGYKCIDCKIIYRYLKIILCNTFFEAIIY